MSSSMHAIRRSLRQVAAHAVRRGGGAAASAASGAPAVADFRAQVNE